MKSLLTEITVTKLERAEQYGDWHDKPLRYIVSGPGAEVQKFSTKKDAVRYRRIRAMAMDQGAAINAYCMAV